MDSQLRIKELETENEALRGEIHRMTNDFPEWDIDIVKYEASEVDEVDMCMMLHKVDNIPVLRSMYIDLFRAAKQSISLIERQRKALELAVKMIDNNG